MPQGFLRLACECGDEGGKKATNETKGKSAVGVCWCTLVYQQTVII